jgi:ferredoxin
MANLTERLARNQSGKFYVDASCIDCDQCRSLAPAFFSRDEELGFSIVHRQPAEQDEIALAQEAMDSCPTGSIGNDGIAVVAS